MLARLWTSFKARPSVKADESWALYYALCDLARAPVFYHDRYAIPDTLDGRFDWASLCLGISCLHISAMPDGQGQDFSQDLFDHFFKQLELNLREGGIGDLSVPKHMRRMIQAFYGRMAALAEILHTSSQPEEDVAVLLARNIYGLDVPHHQAYMLAQWLLGDFMSRLLHYQNISQINDLIGEVQQMSQVLSLEACKERLA